MTQSRRTKAHFMEPARLMPIAGDDQRWPAGVQIDWLAMTAVALFIFLAWQLFFEQADASDKVSVQEAGLIEASDQSGRKSAPFVDGSSQGQANQVSAALDPTAIHYPYDEFWISQGPHGAEYGHMAIDMVAGKGSPIKSPIAGLITDSFVDQYGNTTLIVENERYRVTLMHGEYTVAIGQEIDLDQILGSESNHGYTTDIYGISCWNRDCGYHTHLNVFDKGVGQNVNPLDVLAK